MGQVLVITARVRVGNQVSPFSAPVVVTAGGVADNPLDAGGAGGTEADQLRGVDAPVQGAGAGDLSAGAATMKDAPGQGASAGDKSTDGVGALGQSYTEPRSDSAAAGDKPAGGAWYAESVRQSGAAGTNEADTYTAYVPPVSGAQVAGVGTVATGTTSVTPALPTSGIAAGQPMYCFIGGVGGGSNLVYPAAPAGWIRKGSASRAYYWRRASGDSNDVAPAFTGLTTGVGSTSTVKAVVIALGGCATSGPTYAAGTLTAASTSTGITGSGTAWNAAMEGCQITIEGVNYTVLTVNSTTNLTLTTSYAGTSGSGKAYSIALDSVEAASVDVGTAALVHPAAITTLTNGALLLFVGLVSDSDTYDFSSAVATLGIPTGPATTQAVKSNGATGADSVALGVWGGTQATAGLTGAPSVGFIFGGDSQAAAGFLLAITPGP